VETVISCIFFFSKAGKFKTNMAQVPYNKLLTNLASSSRTEEYWPSVIFVRTSGQYSPVQPMYSVSKRLLFKGVFYDQIDGVAMGFPYSSPFQPLYGTFILSSSDL